MFSLLVPLLQQWKWEDEVDDYLLLGYGQYDHCCSTSTRARRQAAGTICSVEQHILYVFDTSAIEQRN
jgi:hypothetical protein